MYYQLQLNLPATDQIQTSQWIIRVLDSDQSEKHKIEAVGSPERSRGN